MVARGRVQHVNYELETAKSSQTKDLNIEVVFQQNMENTTLKSEDEEQKY